MKALRSVAPIFLIFAFVFNVRASSLDPSKTVLPVHELKLLGAAFGTAACLDAQCRFLLTNAHVAMVASPRAIHGDPVVQKLLATGPHDQGAAMQPGGAGASPYNPLRDIAIYELVRPIKGFQGMPFSLQSLQEGDGVQIVAFPGRAIGITDFSRTLTTWQATYVADNRIDGCLLFKYKLPDAGGKIRPGSSGGIVVHNGAIVGILRGMAGSDLVAEAVPISSLEEFLAKVNPYLHAQLFPQATAVAPFSPNAFPPWDTSASTPGVLQRRSGEPPDVQRVRAKAQKLYDSMKYLMARQVFSWSDGGSPKMEAAYDLKVRDGLEIFSDGRREYAGEIPLPAINGWVLASELWLNAPRYANGDLSLHIRHAGLTTVYDKPIDVYQWQALGPESGICRWDEVTLFKFFRRDLITDVGCSGEIWLSPDGDILRISKEYDRPFRKWSDFESVVVYGKVVLDGESHLVPLTISTHVRYGKSRTFYCDGMFSNYKLWGSQVRLAPSP